MKFLPLALGLAVLASPAHAVDPRFLASLSRLDSATRLEQICDYEAMTRISQGVAGVDRAKSNVLSNPQHLGDTLIAKGAAFRAGGKWYQVTFTCKATPDHKAVVSFAYKVGAMIPPTKWQTYGLWR